MTRHSDDSGRGLRLLATRNFTLLWTGDVLSELGSQATTVAMPLLVLALTGSPAKAGIVGLARSVAYPLAPLPAGVLVDRFDRRHVLMACAAGRGVAMGSLVAALALGRPPFLQLVAVAFLNAALWSVAMIAERGLLPAVVPEGALADAVALNEAREAAATIGGPPLGGALFGVGRALPFLADAATFVAAVVAVWGVRVEPRVTSTGAAPGPARAAIAEGLRWLWRAPFLRAGSLLYAAANVTIASVELLAVLIARRHGASSAGVGVAFAVIGAAGVASALLARPLRRRLPTRPAVLCEPWTFAALLPVLLVSRSALAVGGVVGAMVLPMATSSSIVVGQRLALTPDHLRGRVQAAASFTAGSIGWIGPLGIGLLFEHAGETATVLALTGWALAVAAVATASAGLRQIPAAPAAEDA